MDSEPGKTPALLRLVREARRRRVFRVAALYIIGAWVILQVADVLFPGLGIPDTAISALLFAALLGFPVALVFGWMYDIGSGGIRRTRPLSPGREPEPTPLRRADYLVLAALVAVLGVIGVNAMREVMEAPREVAAAGPGSAVVAAPKLERSIAVLPFSSLSADPEDEYFSSGIAEEILHRLAGVKELNVIGRTSSFAFRGKDVSATQLCTLLGARFLLDGSVRRAGDQVRITAQLLDENGVQVWSQNFDRELNDVFAIQSEVAELVTTTVAPQVAPPAEQSRAPDLAAYEHYLAGREFLHRRLFELAQHRLEQAIDIDPGFAEAHAEYAIALLIGNPSDGDIKTAQAEIDKALALSPGLVRAKAAQGLMYSHHESPDWAAAEAILGEALAQDPSDGDALVWYSSALAALGREDESRAVLKRAARVDPYHPTVAANLARTYIEQGDTDQAETLLLRQLNGPTEPGTYIYWTLYGLYQSSGRLVDMIGVARREALGAQPRSYFYMAQSYAILGDFETASYWMERTRRDFPRFEYMPIVRSRVPMWSHRYDDALTTFDEELAARQLSLDKLAPLFWNWAIVLHAMAGEHENAIELASPVETEFPPVEFLGFFRQDALILTAWSYQQLGQAEPARNITTGLDRRFREAEADLAPVPYGKVSMELAYLDALNTLLLGEPDRALDRLQELIELGWSDVYILPYAPLWQPLSDHPRFQAMMAEVRSRVDAQRAEVERLDALEDFIAQVDAARAAAAEQTPPEFQRENQ